MRPSSVRQCRCPHCAHTSNTFVRQCIVLASKLQVAQPFVPVICKGNISLQVLRTKSLTSATHIIQIIAQRAARTRQLQAIRCPCNGASHVVHGQCCRAGTSATWKANNRGPCCGSAKRGNTSKQIRGMVTPIIRAAQDKLVAPVCSCDRVRQ